MIILKLHADIHNFMTIELFYSESCCYKSTLFRVISTVSIEIVTRANTRAIALFIILSPSMINLFEGKLSRFVCIQKRVY